MQSPRFSLVFLASLAAIGGASADGVEHESLVWRGCGISKTAFMEACAEEYAKETGIEIQLSGGGATLGIEAAGTGGADLGGTCRAPQKERGEERPGLKLAVVAWDALVAIVHPSNPVESISADYTCRESPAINQSYRNALGSLNYVVVGHDKAVFIYNPS